MILIQIVALVALTATLGVLVWYVVHDKNINGTSNYCTHDCEQGRHCSCGQTTNPNWPFPVGPKP